MKMTCRYDESIQIFENLVRKTYPRHRLKLGHEIFFQIAGISSQFRVGLVAHNSLDKVACCAGSRAMESVLEAAVATLTTAESHQLRVFVRVHVIG